MSFLDSVSNSIQASDSSQASQQAPGTSGQASYNQNVNNDILAMLQGNLQQQPAELSPEEELQDFFTPKETDFKEESFDPNSIFGDVNPEELQAAIGQMNFVEGVFTPELAEAIAGGGQEAVTALAKAMNAMGQRIAMQSFTTGTRMVTQGIAKAAPAWNNAATSNLRNTTITNAIKDADPLLSSPLAEPMVAKLREAIISKQPNATAQEVKDIATKMVTVMQGKSAQQQQQQQQQQQENVPYDWDAFFKS